MRWGPNIYPWWPRMSKSAFGSMILTSNHKSLARYPSAIIKYWLQYVSLPLDVSKSQTLDLYRIRGTISSPNLQFHTSPAPCSVSPPLIGPVCTTPSPQKSRLPTIWLQNSLDLSPVSPLYPPQTSKPTRRDGETVKS